MHEEKQSSTPNFNKLEQEILKFWEDNKTFEKSLEQTKNNPPYIFYDGPPFATGLPHYGHILASTIKDAIPRYQTMKGHYVRRRWGWDCHGLPIENIVEQSLKISGKKQIEELGVKKFNQICRENVLKFVDEWGKMVRRMGRWVDFENSYKTMDSTYMESVWWALKQIWDKGLIYENRKVLLYCSRCETPISNFEVAMDNSYREINEESVYAKFKMAKGRIGDNLINDKTYALVWTTTPWTLPGNTSLNIGPEIVYVMIDHENKERYILAKDRLSIIEGEYEIVAEFPARALEHLEYEPLYPGVITDPNNRAHRIYTAQFVTTTDGTGIVHNAAMYGEEDYQLAQEKNLPRQDMLDHQGKYLNQPNLPEHLRGVFFKKADKIILAELKEQGKVYKTENYLHSYPHCYRCATPLFYNALPAWFINIQKIKPELLSNNEQINWHPAHLKHGRFRLGLENAPDWNISRSRYWATALPFWKCKNQDCKNVSCVGSVAELSAKSINFSQVYANYVGRTDSIDLHRPYIDNILLKCDRCGGEMNRIAEVVDCWVESASMPFAEFHFPFENEQEFKNRYPADFVAEYIAQTRAWFYVMHVMGTMQFSQAPFKSVITTGTILAEDGSKMSKSKNNYPDPWVVIEKYGIDAIRFYLLTTPVMNGDDLNFSEKGVSEVNRKVSLLIYNVWSFYRMYEKGVNRYELQVSSDNVLDKWIIAKLNQTCAEVTAHMDVYNTVKAGKILIDFINDLSTWYVRRSRDRIKAGNESAKQALNALGFTLVQTAKLLAPFMPFLSDFIYKDITGLESVHLVNWPNFSAADAPEALKKMELAREAVSFGLAVRKQKNLAVRQPLPSFAYVTSEGRLEPEYEQLIIEELNVKKIEPALIDKDTRPQGAVAAQGLGLVNSVYFDITITPELKLEGVVRGLERAVQDLRKKSGLKVGELVDVYYNTQDESLEQALLNSLDRKKTFVNQINKSLEVEVDFEIQSEIDGRAIWIGMVKI